MDYICFIDWLKVNKISLSGKFRNKRWGTLNEKESNWTLRVCVQYDDFLVKFLADKNRYFKNLVENKNGYLGCGHCLNGKCAFTGFEVTNPDNEQIEVMKE